MRKQSILAISFLALFVAAALAAVVAVQGPSHAAPPPDDEQVSVSPPTEEPASAAPHCPCGGDCKCLPDSNCGCGVAVAKKADPFAAAYAEHARTGSPLVVWVGGAKDPYARRRVAGSCVCEEMPEFVGRSHRCVLVGVWHEGHSYVAAELPEGATAEEILRAATAKQQELSPPPAPAFAPQIFMAPPMPMMGGGGGRGGC